MPLSSGNPPTTKYLEEVEGAQPQGRSVDNSVAFDPTAVASSDEFVFDTHEVITNYLEKLFVCLLINTYKTQCIKCTSCHEHQ